MTTEAITQDTITTAGPEETNIVTLTDEEGKEHEFEVVDIIEVDGKEYALLLPTDSTTPEEDVVLVLRYDNEAAAPFSMIEDEVEFQKVVAELEKLQAEDDADDTTVL